MNLKNRIERIEKAINASGGVRLEWIEQDENGEFPPVQPGEMRINLEWDAEPAGLMGLE